MNNENFEWEIGSRQHKLALNLVQTWQYRDLLWLMVRRDFVSFYKQTIFGPVWFFVQPLATAFIFTFIFGDLAGIPTDGLPQMLFYMAGNIAWNYFADCLTKTSTVFKDNAQLFGKIYFPRLIVPLSIVISALTRFGVQFLLFAATMIFFLLKGKAFNPNWYMLLFPYLVILMAALGLGFGMIISALTTKYRDLSFVVAFGIQLLMYTTTVIYPLSVAVKKFNWSWIMQYNPMTPIIEAIRFGFLGKGTFSWFLIGYTSMFSMLILFAGVWVFNKVERNFIDTI